MGLAMGMFASPNTASIMNSVPPEHRGSAAGMRSTLQNSGSTIGLSLLFTITLVALSSSLPQSVNAALLSAGAPQLASVFDRIPPTTALFAAFLGYNPMQTILSQLPPSITGSISNQARTVLTGTTWFPQAIAPAFMSSLTVAFYFNAVLAVLAAAASALRGKKYVYGLEGELEAIAVRVPTSRSGSARTVRNGPSRSAMIRTSANEATAPSDSNESADSEPERVEASTATKGPEER